MGNGNNPNLHASLVPASGLGLSLEKDGGNFPSFSK